MTSAGMLAELVLPPRAEPSASDKALVGKLLDYLHAELLKFSPSKKKKDRVARGLSYLVLGAARCGASPHAPSAARKCVGCRRTLRF